MPKVQYSQNYRNEWESIPEFKDWIQPVSSDRTKAFCKFCKTEIRAKVFDLKKHLTTTKHISAAKPFSSKRQTKLDFKPSFSTTSSSIAEAKLSLFIAAHSSLNTSGHLSLLYKEIFTFRDCKTADFRLKRTKCKALILNVLAPHFVDRLLNDIGDKKFSIIIDESTDIAVSKLLTVCIRYFSTEMNKIVSTFLGIIELEKCDANSIVQGIKELLNSLKLDPKKIQGVGTDNASVMCGVKNGVYVKMKSEFRNNSIILIRCICHSLQLALSHATEETLPRNIEFMIRETYKWF